MQKTTFCACLLLLVLSGKELLWPLLVHAARIATSCSEHRSAPGTNCLLLLSFGSALLAGCNVAQAQTPQGEELYNSHSAIEANSVPRIVVIGYFRLLFRQPQQVPVYTSNLGLLQQMSHMQLCD